MWSRITFTRGEPCRWPSAPLAQSHPAVETPVAGVAEEDNDDNGAGGGVVKGDTNVGDVDRFLFLAPYKELFYL